jgi:dolichol-phosphate mannosyltransferase
MINFSLDAITGFSLKPLRFIIYLGLLSSFLSVCAFFYSTSMMTAACLLSSVQLICLGVVGEYVGRTFIESKKRPLFLIQETTDMTDFSVTEVIKLTTDSHNEVVH